MTADTQAPRTAAPTTHQGILDFVNEVAAMTTPDRIHWCTGSDEEWTELTDALVATGTFTRLDPAKKPNSLPRRAPTRPTSPASRTAPSSARVDEKDAGLTNNWMAPSEMKELMRGLYAGCMRGRTMYVIPFVMGHLEAEKPMFGVEITDSAYVTASMRVMARIGTDVLRRMEELDARVFVPALHSVGMPLEPTARPTSRGRATTPSTSCSSPRSAPSGPSAPATAATRCSARSATPCASPA